MIAGWASSTWPSHGDVISGTSRHCAESSSEAAATSCRSMSRWSPSAELSATTEVDLPTQAGHKTAMSILLAISFSHLLNDMMQSLIPAMYPMLKSCCQPPYVLFGLLTFTYQITASLLQPVIGAFTDRKPKPYSLAVGMSFTLCGLLLLATAHSFGLLLVAAALVGTGSSVFHPESSRVARMASGGAHGLA